MYLVRIGKNQDLGQHPVLVKPLEPRNPQKTRKILSPINIFIRVIRVGKGMH